MTTDEAKAVLADLFIAFPQFKQWLAGTDDPNATHAAWCQMLARNTTLEDSLEAVDRIKNGVLSLPSAYERDRLPLLLRSYSLRIKQDRLTVERAAKSTGHGLGQGSPFKYHMGDLLRKLKASVEAMQAGHKSEDEHAELVKRLQEMAKEKA